MFLRPSGPDNQYFSATGQLLEVTETTRRYIRAIYLLDRDSLFRLNAHLWTLLNAAFDLSAFTALCPEFSAAHAYKLLLILLYNRTHYARVSITKAIQLLPTSPCSTCEELATLHSSVVAYSVLHNVLNGKFAFAPVAEILHHVTDGIQRTTSNIPTHLQPDFRKAAQVLHSRFSRALGVHPTALLLRLAPTLQPPLEPLTSATPGPAAFVTLMAGTDPDAATASSVFTSSAPSAFMARRGSAPLSDRERYERPTHPRSGTRDRPRPSHDRPPSSLRRDDTRDFERRPPSSIRRDDTADSERLERLETQLAELRADRGRRSHSVNYAAERPSDSSNDDDGAPLPVAYGAQLASPTEDQDERALRDYAAYQRRLAARK